MSERNNRRVVKSDGCLFRPDLLLADQLTAVRGMAVYEGERQLMVAVLEDAAHCFQKYMFARDKRGRNLFEEAEEWIMEEGTGAAFAFRQVCEVLGLDPDYIRAGLRTWQAGQMQRMRQRGCVDVLSSSGTGMLADHWSSGDAERRKRASGGG